MIKYFSSKQSFQNGSSKFDIIIAVITFDRSRPKFQLPSGDPVVFIDLIEKQRKQKNNKTNSNCHFRIKLS